MNPNPTLQKLRILILKKTDLDCMSLILIYNCLRHNPRIPSIMDHIMHLWILHVQYDWHCPLYLGFTKNWTQCNGHLMIDSRILHLILVHPTICLYFNVLYVTILISLPVCNCILYVQEVLSSYRSIPDMYKWAKLLGHSLHWKIFFQYVLYLLCFQEVVTLFI